MRCTEHCDDLCFLACVFLTDQASGSGQHGRNPETGLCWCAEIYWKFFAQAYLRILIGAKLRELRRLSSTSQQMQGQWARSCLRENILSKWGGKWSWQKPVEQLTTCAARTEEEPRGGVNGSKRSLAGYLKLMSVFVGTSIDFSMPRPKLLRNVREFPRLGLPTECISI